MTGTPPKQVRVYLAPGGSGSWIEVNGERLTNVRGISLNARVGQPTIATVEFVAVKVDVHGEVDDIDMVAEVTDMDSPSQEWRRLT